MKAYAAFCVLRDKFVSADSDHWGEHFVQYSESIWSELTSEPKLAEQINLQMFVQFLLHQQLKEAVEFCHALGVAVKGDISFGVYRKSADAWANSDLFNMDMQAGAHLTHFLLLDKTGNFQRTTGTRWLKTALIGGRVA